MIIGLSGYAQSGKNTVGDYLVNNYGFTQIAFADALKQMAYVLNPIIGVDNGKRFPAEESNPDRAFRLQEVVDAAGWDIAKKDPEVRRILQVLGTECGRDILGENVWVNIVAKYIGSSVENIVITDVRFPNERDMVKAMGKLWWIEREGVTALNAHSSENSVTKEDADFVVPNKGDLNDLYEWVKFTLFKDPESSKFVMPFDGSLDHG